MYRKVFKRVIDFVLSSIIILLLIPIFIITYIFVKADTKGPFFFYQERLGKNGDLFKIYKIRTMTDRPRTPNREILAGDLEVTKVGSVLRRLKVDELPQIINIWKGDMSFVGPRPSLPSQISELNEDGKKRILVRPGLTGLAQVNGNIYLSWEDRWKFDRKYVEELCFLLDLKIITKTILVVIFGEEKYLNNR